MNIFTIVYTVLALPCVAHLMWIYHIQSSGVVPFKHHIINSIVRIIANSFLIFNDWAQLALLSWIVLDWWVVYTNVKGLRRSRLTNG